MSMYVQDEHVLGNPGVFGFIGKAIQTVGKVLTGQTTVKLPTVPTPQVNVELPPGSVPTLPSWAIPVGLGLVALLILKPRR
jgi:hypothetical protein